MIYRVLATARSFCNTPGAHHDFLRQNGCRVDLKAQEHPLTATQLGQLIAGYQGVILGLDTCDASVIDQANSLRVISRYGSGVDSVDLDAAGRRGIAVTNTPNANQQAVAELAIGLLFALARNLPSVAANARGGIWKRAPGWELSGKTLGIVGLGAIGQQVAASAHGLGMKVLAYDPFWKGTSQAVQLTELDSLLHKSQVISLHCPLTPETRNIINATTIDQMPDGAYLINTARGGLVDEGALYEALKSNRLAGAAMDVFEQDPPTNSPLLTLDTFIATPHIGATTRESVERMSMMAAQNLVAVLRGDPCPYIVNRDHLPKQ